jgi:signal peptide peptidase SppA
MRDGWLFNDNKRNAMSKKLLRLTENLLARPHLISQEGYDAIMAYLDRRNNGLVLSEFGEVDEEPPVAAYDTSIGIGLLEVHGALTYKPVVGMCGVVGTSYSQLLAEATEMVEAGVKTIVMDIDSRGGEGYAAFETANQLRTLCDANGARLIAYNDGCTASAAYALACVADEVISNPAAETGSIGVLIALMNDSKALEMNGYSRSFITAGKSKIPFADDGSFRPEFLADLQVKVDAMYEQFTSHVSTHTGMSVDEVKGTEARMFMAQDALALGLINKVMTHAEFIDYIANLSKET